MNNFFSYFRGKSAHQWIAILLFTVLVSAGILGSSGEVYAGGSFDVPKVNDQFNQFEQDSPSQQEQTGSTPSVKEEKGFWDSVTQPFADAWEWTKEKAAAFGDWLAGVLSKITEVVVNALAATWDWVVKFKEYIAFAGVLILGIVLCIFAAPLGVAVLTGMALSLLIGAGFNGWKFDKTVFLEAAIGGLLGLIGGGIAGGASRGLAGGLGQKIITGAANSKVLGPIVRGGSKLISKLPKPMQQIFAKAGFVGSVEGAGTSVADDLLHGRKINWKNALLSGVAGAALVGVGAFIVPKVEPIVNKVTTAFQKAPVVKAAKRVDDCIPFAYQQQPGSYTAMAVSPFAEFAKCISAQGTDQNSGTYKARLKTEKPKYNVPDRNFTIKDGKDKQGRSIKYAILPDGQEVKLLSSQYAGGKNKNGIPFDKDGFVDFSKYVKAEVYLKPEQLKGDSATQTGQATRILRDYLEANPKLKKEFMEQFPENERNLINEHLNSGNHKIGNYTWHHHQETGRMQLIPSDVHRKGYPHTGGHRIWGR